MGGLFVPLTLHCPASLRAGPDSCPRVRRHAAHPALARRRRVKGVFDRDAPAATLRYPAPLRSSRQIPMAAFATVLLTHGAILACPPAFRLVSQSH
jgi:hypothetical protein